MSAPRWTHTEANASRWRHLFDDLIGGTPALEVPLEGNGKSLCSLHIRISDALKWLADQVQCRQRRNGALRPPEAPHPLLHALRLHIKRPHHYRPIPHLDPALLERLQSALQRPDMNPSTRAKIEAVLGRKNDTQ